LNDEVVRARADVTIWLLTDESPATWAHEAGFTGANIVQTDLTRYRLSGVPAVLVVNAEGIVLKTVEGVTEEGMTQIFDAIRQ
jgi:hypothetical protein